MTVTNEKYKLLLSPSILKGVNVFIIQYTIR